VPKVDAQTQDSKGVEGPRFALGGCAGVIAGAFWFLFCAGLLQMVVLKETPVFWRNEGGYPVELRDFVKLWFYPLLLVGGVGLLGATGVLLRVLLAQRARAGLMPLLLMVPAWLLYALVVGVLVANNLMNLIENRPLHYH
jgi:hypothetical protein